MDVAIALQRQRFAVAAGLAVLVTLGAAVVVLAPAFSPYRDGELVQAAAAIYASAACVWASRQVTGRARVAWLLLAASAATWAVGALIKTYYEVALQTEVPVPSFADAALLLSIPLEFAAVRAFWTAPRGTPSRWRVWLDAVTIALALSFTAWAFGLGAIWADSDPRWEKVLELSYPLGDILVGTVLILALRRAANGEHVRIFLLLGGLAVNAVANSALSYMTANGAYVDGNMLELGWVIGYLLVALAAAAPRSRERSAADGSPVDLWQLALPWMTVAVAGGSAAYIAISGRQMDLFLTSLVGIGAALLTVNMIFTNRDLLRMVIQSRSSEAALAEVIENAPVGIARADTKFRLIGANPALGALLGTTPDSMLGLTFDRYLPGEAQGDVFEKFAKVASGAAETATGELPLLRADGSRVWARWTSTAVRKSSGETDYVLTTLENMDAQHQAETAAMESLQTLQRLNKVKTEFLQNVSHEFKTALLGIQGFSEFMRDADQLDVNDARAFAADIYRDAERLDRMVNEMLALDTVESSRDALRVERVDLDAVIRQEVGASNEQVHGNTVVMKIQPDLPAVAGDRAKLSEVVHALMENAIKRSPDGGRILVSATANGSGVEVSFRDQGVGAQSEYDNRLFGKEDLYANSPIRKVVGTGLALGIARQVVEAHGGRFWLNGGGVEFHFSIPVLWKDREEVVALTGSSARVA